VWVPRKCGCEKCIIISAYGPRSEKTDDERKEFWETLSECVNGFEYSERIVVLGDMNIRVEDV
jgi:exonuclease III